MSGAVKKITSTVSSLVLAPLKAVGLVDEPQQAMQQPETTGLSEAERSTLASEEAKRKRSQAKGGTSSVLTSPLGSTTTARTAVRKLGG